MTGTILHMHWGAGSEGRPVLSWKSGSAGNAIVPERPAALAPTAADPRGSAGGPGIGVVLMSGATVVTTGAAI
jgi:hypothetical protein